MSMSGEEEWTHKTFMDITSLPEEVLCRICNHLDAVSIARFGLCCNKELRRVLGDERIVANWVANSDQWKKKWEKSVESDAWTQSNARRQHPNIHEPDLSTNVTEMVIQANEEGSWTLEKLHVLDKPPRFEAFRFPFGNARLVHQDTIEEYHYSFRNDRDVYSNPDLIVVDGLSKISEFMRTHACCRLVVNGYTQPDCPDAIALSISAERVRVVCQYIARMLIAGMLGIDPTHRPGTLSNIPCFLKKDIMMSSDGDMILRSLYRKICKEQGRKKEEEGGGGGGREEEEDMFNGSDSDSGSEESQGSEGSEDTNAIEHSENESEDEEMVSDDDSDSGRTTEFDPLLADSDRHKISAFEGMTTSKETISPRRVVEMVESRFVMKAHGNSNPRFDNFEFDRLYTTSDEGKTR